MRELKPPEVCGDRRGRPDRIGQRRAGRAGAVGGAVMSVMTDPLVILMLVVGPLSLVAWACDAYTRRKRPNRGVRFSRVAGPRRDEPVKDPRDWQRLFNESIRP